MQNRRTLHQPFFPLTSPPPSSSSSQPPSPSPSYPKYPFSTTTNNPAHPFFPNYPSPPPPPSSSSGSSDSSLPTFPANISSIIYPNYPSPTPNSTSHSKLLPAIVISLIALSLIILASAFLFHRRRHRHRHRSHPDHNYPHPKDPTTTTTTPPPPPTTTTPSDFLYLGTLVNSRQNSGDQTLTQPHNAAPSPKLGSPELHPLPPLSRHLRPHAANGASSDEEFYSPRADDNSAAKPKCGGGVLRSSVSSTPSYPTSSGSAASSPVLASSPADSAACSGNLRSKPSFSMRPLTPSPPKRKPPTPSPPLLSPTVKSSADFAGNLFAAFGPTPPPPPPPPPPFGYWESQTGKPPVLATPKFGGMVSKATPEALPSNAVERNYEETPRTKLKPLHWDKVRASSDRAMVWDQLKSSSFQVNEEMIETLFGCNTNTVASKEANYKHQVLPSPNQENRVLDPKKSQNIAILLRALNVTKEEVCEALIEGNTDSLGTELLETLLKMAPTREEELKLKENNDDSPFKLGPAEKFLKALLDIPFAFKRLEAMLYITNFDSEVSYLRNSFETLEAACEELRNSRLFLKLLEAVLKTGNRMNIGTNRGDAHAFKLDTLLKLVDVKGTDGKTTLLHFVVQEIIRTEGSRLSASRTQANTLQDDHVCKKLGLQVVAGLGGELSNVKKAASMDSEVLSSYVSKLAGGIEKIAEVLRLNEALSLKTRSPQFNEAMGVFLKKAEDEIIKVQAQESVALSLVKEITEYFHGNSAKEEAHPFRIFTVVRDFLSTLDQVCKEVGKINERTMASNGRQFPVPVNPTLPPLFPRIQAPRPEVSDDDSSSSSSS